MTFPRILLWVNCALFVAFGVGFIGAPGFLSTLITGGAPSISSALIDMRATYGGMGLGVGLFFAFCARQPSSVRLGLIASLLVLGSIAAGRLIGIVVDGSPNAFMFVLLVAEMLFVALVMVAIKSSKHA